MKYIIKVNLLSLPVSFFIGSLIPDPSFWQGIGAAFISVGFTNMVLK